MKNKEDGVLRPWSILKWRDTFQHNQMGQ